MGRFLDHIYTNIMSTLKPGHARYGLMLSDDGLILDDGVALRLSEHRWIISTSTGHADAINSHMEELLQTRFPDWNVFVTTVTSQWNNATICGPKAREVMAALGTDIDISPKALPFMGFADGTVAGVPARVVRVSFTGELSFEVNVAPRHLAALWDRILAAGAPFGIEPIGSEANHVLRSKRGSCHWVTRLTELWTPSTWVWAGRCRRRSRIIWASTPLRCAVRHRKPTRTCGAGAGTRYDDPGGRAADPGWCAQTHRRAGDGLCFQHGA